MWCELKAIYIYYIYSIFSVSNFLCLNETFFLHIRKQSRYDRHGEWEIKINGKSNKHKTEKVSVINTCCWLIYSTEDSEEPESLSPGMFDHSPRISYIKKVVSMDCT